MLLELEAGEEREGRGKDEMKRRYDSVANAVEWTSCILIVEACIRIVDFKIT